MAENKVLPGNTKNGNIKLGLPDSENNDYTLKLMSVETLSGIKPIGKYRLIKDVDLYSREKHLYVTETAENELSVFMSSLLTKGNNNDVLHSISYNPQNLEVIDLLGYTYPKELGQGEYANLGIKIESVDYTNGKIVFKFLSADGRNSGINNVVKFRTLNNLVEEEIIYNIQWG